jgi:hypothetical protein
MPDLAIAEAILSLFTPREVAATIAGDLAEEFSSRSLSRFWPAVLGAAFALCLQQIRRRPYRLLALVSVGLVLTQIAVSGLIPMTLLMALGRQHGLPAQAILSVALNLIGSVGGPLLIGWALARFSPGREMTTCGAIALVVASVAFAVGLFGHQTAVTTHFLQGNLVAALLFASYGALKRLRPLTS